MAVSGPALLCQTLVLDGRLEHSATLQLSDISPLNLLPRHLARWILITAGGSKLLRALTQLFHAHQHIHRTLTQVDADAIARAQ